MESHDMSVFGWLLEESVSQSSWLTIGPYTIELTHLKFGNDKTLQPRQILRRDVPLLQSQWPRHRILNIQYTNLLRNAAVPRNLPTCNVSYANFSAKRLLEYLRNYPGQSATLEIPEVTNPVKERKTVRYHGVIIDHSSVELADDRIEITMVMDVTRERFPEGNMVLQ
jgi:hypothetical protein